MGPKRFAFPSIGSSVSGPAELLAIDDYPLPLKKNLCYYLSKAKVQREPVLVPRRDEPEAPDFLATFFAAVFIDHGGLISGKYHKTQLAEGTHPSWHFNRIGKAIRAFDTPIGRVGVMICNDRLNPMIARTLVLDGAQLLLIPSAGSKRRKHNREVLARARENGFPIVYANVGMNLIISKDESVAFGWGNDQITTAVIDVPATASTAHALETEYLDLQGPKMERNYRRRMERLRSEATGARSSHTDESVTA